MGECYSPPAQITLGYPYFPEIRETDGRTEIPKTISEVNLAKMRLYIKTLLIHIIRKKECKIRVKTLFIRLILTKDYNLRVKKLFICIIIKNYCKLRVKRRNI